MRGKDEVRGSLFSYVDLEQRVRPDHPLRVIRGIVNAALAEMSAEFDALYSPTGRDSIPPERLLRALYWLLSGVGAQPPPARRLARRGLPAADDDPRCRPGHRARLLRQNRRPGLVPNVGGRKSAPRHNAEGLLVRTLDLSFPASGGRGGAFGSEGCGVGEHPVQDPAAAGACRRPDAGCAGRCAPAELQATEAADCNSASSSSRKRAAIVETGRPGGASTCTGMSTFGTSSASLRRPT